MNAAFRAGSDALSPLLGRMSTIAAAVGATGTGASLVALEERYTRLGIQAEKSADEIERLKTEVFEVARAGGIRVDAGEITSAIEQIVEKTGDLDFARDNIENIARAIQASGARGEDIGRLVAEFKKLRAEGSSDVLAFMDTLLRQGKAGAFTIQNLASQGERLVSAYAATGRVGATAVRELGAVLQVIRQGTGSSEQATTAFEALLRTLQDADKLKMLRGNGIQVFEKDQPGVMRSVADIMKDIISKTGGDMVKLSQVFDAEAMRAFSAAAAEFKATGSLESLERFLAIQGDGTQLIEDSARAAGTAKAGITNLRNAWQQFADSKLTGPIQMLTAALNSLSAETVNKIFIAGAAIAGLAIAAQVIGPVLALGKMLIFLGGAVVPLFGWIGSLAVALRAGYGAMAAFNLVLAANPIGVVVTAVAALAAAAYLIYENWAPIAAFFGGMWDGIKRVFATGSLWVLEKIQSVAQALPGFARKGLGLDGLDATIKQMRQAAAPLGVDAQLGAASPLGVAGGGQEITNKVHIVVDSEGRPRVRETTSSSDSTKIDVSAGYIMGSAG